MPIDEHEEELASRQDGRLYPVGRALRATFDAENHDTLGQDVTALMLDLARIDRSAAPRLESAAPEVASIGRISLLGRLYGALGRRNGR